MDKKRAVINIFVGIAFKIIILILSIITKSYVVKYLGDEANGLFSLYTSILGFITIANLGVGVAITFSMYRPIVENDTDAVSALYHLYRKFYMTVMLIVLGVGLLITPLVPFLAKDISGNKMIYITYITFLVSIAVTYLFGHKISLINAYRDNYITTALTSFGLIIEGIIQIIVILLTKNFLYFLLVRIFAYLVEGLLVEIIFRIKYKQKLNKNKKINADLKKEVIKNSGAMMYSEIGTKLISSFDGIIISFFVGVVALGNYSNYIIIITGMVSLLNLFFSEITSILGHVNIKQSKESYFNQFKKVYSVNFILGIVFFMGFIAISDNIVEIMFTKNHIETRFIVVVIAFDYFLNFMRRSLVLFKRASGVIYEDRHRPLIEGIINIILSIILVQFLGVGGVLVGTILTRLVVSFTFEPHVLFIYGFEKQNAKSFYKVHYGSFVVLIATSLIYILIPTFNYSSVYLNLLLNGLVSVALSIVVLFIVYLIFKPFKKSVNGILKSVFRTVFKRK